VVNVVTSSLLYTYWLAQCTDNIDVNYFVDQYVSLIIKTIVAVTNSVIFKDSFSYNSEIPAYTASDNM